MKDILVIEDEEEVRAVITTILNYARYTVREAKNGQDGILMALAQKPDLILCDVLMPEMDGYRTLAAVRSAPGTAAIPFILMTGCTRPDENRQAMICGPDGYLMKPFSALELMRAVESRLISKAHVRTEVDDQTEKAREHLTSVCSPVSHPIDTTGAAAAQGTC